MQALTVVLIPSETTDGEAAVAALIEPYNLLAQVPVYTSYFSSFEVEFLDRQYHVDASDLHGLTAEIRERRRWDCDVDDGGLFCISTDNPNGKWDSWDILDLSGDVWDISQLPRDLDPSVIVTPAGVWHEQDYRWNSTDEVEARSRKQAYEPLDRYPAFKAVAVWCHR
jgi:hypothetical protein